MARVGQFMGPTQVFGAPLSVIQPPDNRIAKSRYYQGLLDPSLGLTQAQIDEMNQEVNDLFRVLQIGRDLPTQ